MAAKKSKKRPAPKPHRVRKALRRRNAARGR
jgi:hypothetical protein